MGKVAKTVRWAAILGGLGAAAWAVRDRFISLTIPRQSEPPRFKQGPQPSAVADDLTVIAGIGPVFADRLAGRSITTLRRLAQSSAEEISEVTGASQTRAAGWIAEAAHRVSQASQADV